MANARFYSSIAAVTNLQVTASPTDATIQVASSVGFPGSFPYTLSLDYGAANEELVDVTGGGPSVFNVTRHVDGTSASTHNAGAVVRHVTSARDFTDSRTHEASTTGVHGISGQFVDTLSTQTLANKTLTSPTLNSATLNGTLTATGATISNGTFSGGTLSGGRITGATAMVSSPSFTGAWSNAGDFTNTGQLLQQNLVRGQRANATDSMYEARVAGDANARWFTRADGAQFWGPGTGAVDVSLTRAGTNTLAVGGGFNVTGAFNGGGAVTASGGLTGTDLVLTSQTQTPFTPAWTVGGSPATTTNVGWYWKLGKLVFFEIYTQWSASGTGTSNIAANLPTIPFRDGAGANTTRQLVSGYATGTSVISPTAVYGLVLAGGTGTAMTVLDPGNNALQSNNIQNGTIIVFEGFYREA